MAISARKFEEPDHTFIFPRGGYGIHLNINPTFGACESASSGYCIFLFADCNDDNKYNSSGSALTCNEATSGNPYPYEKIEELSLENGIKVPEFSHSEYYDYLNITFFPPDPEVTFNLGGPDLEEDSVFISLTINGSDRRVKVYRTGLIEID